MRHIVLASNNPGKIRELNSLLHIHGFTVEPQSNYNVPSIEETGLTFVENALLKARNACIHSGISAIADDSGIEVDALLGAPGIFSARYAGDSANDEDNNRKLLAELQDVPDKQLTACFQCVIVFLRHARDAMPLVCTGTWEGRILHEPIGHNGFGYDPLFYVPTHHCASAELPPDEKNQISHRAQALHKLVETLYES